MILGIDQSIAENALIFVRIQSYETCSGLELGRQDHEHALEDLGDVSQIKGVVELGRCGEEFGGDGVVDLDRRGDDAACAARRGLGPNGRCERDVASMACRPRPRRRRDASTASS